MHPKSFKVSSYFKGIVPKYKTMNFKPIIWTSEPRHDGSLAIKIRLTDGKKLKYHNLKLYTQQIDWDEKKCRVVPRRANADKINNQIVSALNLLEGIHLNNSSLSIDGVLDLFRGGKKQEDLLSFIDVFINKCKVGTLKRAAGTVKGYRVTYNNLVKFRDSGQKVDFKHINQNFYHEWTSFMRKEVEDVKIAFSESTVGKEIKHLKVFLNHALESGVTHNVEHKKKAFKVVNEDSDTIYLNEAETARFMALKVEPHLQLELDRYIVAYFLLLRFSDSMNIDKSKIITNGNKHLLKVKTIKTGESLVVPVKQLVWNILNKYDFTFPVTTNQESNRKLKELGQLATLDEYITTCSTIGGKRVEKRVQKWELLTTHTARRSGATNLLKAGVPENIIMAMGGWKTRASFMRYIRIGKDEFADLASTYDFFK